MRARTTISMSIVILLALGVFLFLTYKTTHAPDDTGGIPYATISYSGIDAEHMIKIDSPKPGECIKSPLKITGQARGNWFFEASFPVVLTNWDGLIIAEGYAEAKDDWMTEDFVPFEATLTFTKPPFDENGSFMHRGTLILKNDNPSGESSRDKAAELPILFYVISK